MIMQDENINKEELVMIKNQLCFPLYACAKEIVKKYKPFLDEINLTYTQYIVMMVMWENRTMNVTELGKHLYLDSGTLTPLLKRLEAKGLIVRERSASDERQLRISITGDGEALKEKAVEVPLKMGACINLSREESTQLYHVLYKLLGQLEKES